MTRDERINAMELEISGIDTELGVLRPQHRSITDKIVSLEADRLQLLYSISFEKAKEARDARQI